MGCKQGLCSVRLKKCIWVIAGLVETIKTYADSARALQALASAGLSRGRDFERKGRT